jgi:hypothetical protein
MKVNMQIRVRRDAQVFSSVVVKAMSPATAGSGHRRRW